MDIGKFYLISLAYPIFFAFNRITISDISVNTYAFLRAFRAQLHKYLSERKVSRTEVVKKNGTDILRSVYNIFILISLFWEQEVLGRTNRLLSLIRHGPHWKRRVQQFFYCYVCIRCRGNISIEPLPSNDRRIFTEPLPSNDKGG
jgi:hypothetical protein